MPSIAQARHSIFTQSIWAIHRKQTTATELHPHNWLPNPFDQPLRHGISPSLLHYTEIPSTLGQTYAHVFSAVCTCLSRDRSGQRSFVWIRCLTEYKNVKASATIYCPTTTATVLSSFDQHIKDWAFFYARLARPKCKTRHHRFDQNPWSCFDETPSVGSPGTYYQESKGRFTLSLATWRWPLYGEQNLQPPPRHRKVCYRRSCFYLPLVSPSRTRASLLLQTASRGTGGGTGESEIFQQCFSCSVGLRSAETARKSRGNIYQCIMHNDANKAKTESLLWTLVRRLGFCIQNTRKCTVDVVSSHGRKIIRTGRAPREAALAQRLCLNLIRLRKDCIAYF